MRRPWRRADPGSDRLEAPALTPLVDLLTLLLIFLLQAWSTDPPVLIPEAFFELPLSRGSDPAHVRLSVDVSEESIRLDGARLVGTAYYAKRDDVLVRELYDPMLQRSREPVAVRADADVPWVVVRKVVYTLREAGVSEVEIVAASASGL